MGDRELFEYMEGHMERILCLDPEACTYISNRNCMVKYRIVMKDERESGLREILNLGHTVGRAIETVSGYRLLHGEAVAIGLVAQAKISRFLGYMTEEEKKRLYALLEKAHLPTVIPEWIDKEALVQKLYTDKKVRDDRLRFVLQKGIGNVVVYGENDYAVPISEDLARKIIKDM